MNGRKVNEAMAELIPNLRKASIRCTPFVRSALMTKAFIAFLITCSSFSSIHCQSTELILTKAQNEQWIDSLSTLPLGSELQMIQKRLLADTNVFVRQSYPDGLKVKDSLGNRVYGVGKPLLIVEDVALPIGNKTETKKIIALTQLLSIDNISSIAILKGTDPLTTTVYGSNGMNGVILMKLKWKKDIQKFKKLKLASYY